MTQIDDTAPSGSTAMLSALLAGRAKLLRQYFTAISGSAGRLVFSLVYFIALANSLEIADFGLFATASAAGVMLSRVLAFGFMAPLYRIATVKPRLVGVFAGGFILTSILSLPLLGLATLAVHQIFFGTSMAFMLFAGVVFAEALLWRPTEAVIIVNNGMNRFGRAAMLVIFGTATRAVAAFSFAFVPEKSLAVWVAFYIGANAVSLAVALFFFPRQRIRFRPRLYWRRMADAIYVGGAEILFYLQTELDKLLVLALGGPTLAGIYAIIMRLVDLTAIPVRTFTMLLVQRMMRMPHMLKSIWHRVGVESGIFVVSTLAILALGTLLHFFPTILGRNVAEAAPLVIFALFIPGLRNLTEYQAELLFARGQTLVRVVNLSLLAGLKAVVLTGILGAASTTETMVVLLNGMFAVLYLASMLLTYAAMRMPAKPV